MAQPRLPIRSALEHIRDVWTLHSTIHGTRTAELWKNHFAHELELRVMQGDELVESHQGPSLRQHTSRRHRRGTEAKLIEQGWFELPPKATHLRFTDPPPFDAGASWFGNLAFVAAATIRDELEPTVHKPVCNGFGMELRHLYTTARQASQANA